jgi:hypothetical protein
MFYGQPCQCRTIETAPAKLLTARLAPLLRPAPFFVCFGADPTAIVVTSFVLSLLRVVCNVLASVTATARLATVWQVSLLRLALILCLLRTS